MKRIYGSKNLLSKLEHYKDFVLQNSLKIIRNPLKLFSAGKNIFTDKKYRNEIFLKIVNQQNLQQISNFTQINRYPLIFDSCKKYFGNKKQIKILSYGCSTGEEVLTLREYFPEAFIVGAEINPQALAACKKLDVDKQIKFVYSNQRNIRRFGSFDAIFCMAVLQRTPHKVINENITNLTEIYPFSKFEEQVAALDQNLNIGGLMVIHYTQYHLPDTRLGANYKILEGAPQEIEYVPRFDQNSIKIDRKFSGQSIFVKIADAAD